MDRQQPNQVTVAVKIESNNRQASDGEVELRVWEKKERTLRGLKALGISWGFALCTVLIPLLHFILVPLLLIAGPIAFFLASGQDQVILGGKGTCPECGKAIELVRSEVKWPLKDMCNHCQAPLKIARADAS